MELRVVTSVIAYAAKWDADRGIWMEDGYKRAAIPVRMLAVKDNRLALGGTFTRASLGWISRYGCWTPDNLNGDYFLDYRLDDALGLSRDPSPMEWHMAVYASLKHGAQIDNIVPGYGFAPVKGDNLGNVGFYLHSDGTLTISGDKTITIPDNVVKERLLSESDRKLLGWHRR